MSQPVPPVLLTRHGNALRDRLLREHQSGVDREAMTYDSRDRRDATQLGAALLALRRRAPKAPLSKLYDRHRERLERL